MKCIHIAVTGANVDPAIGHRWRGEGAASCVVGPLLRPSGGIERVQIVVSRADIDHATRHRWRGRIAADSCLVGPLLCQTALPHQESDFVFFTLHTFSGSLPRFHGIPPLHQFPLAKKIRSSYNAFQEADFW